MGWLIALAVLAGLAVLPLGISARYRDDGALAQLLVGPIPITLYPKKKKTPKGKKQKEKAKKEEPNSRQGREQGGKFTDFLPIAREIWEFLVDFRRKVRVRLLQIHLVLAEDDPCDLAVHYGDAWAIQEGIMPQIERFFVIEKKDINIACDFQAEHTRIYARLDLTITVGRLVAVLVCHGSKIIQQLTKIIKMSKGGA